MAVLEPVVVDASRVALLAVVPPPHVVVLHDAPDGLTVVALSLTLAKAIAADDADLVLDLHDVRVLDALAVNVVLRANDFLVARSRRVTVRAPSRGARRALVARGATRLIER